MTSSRRGAAVAQVSISFDAAGQLKDPLPPAHLFAKQRRVRMAGAVGGVGPNGQVYFPQGCPLVHPNRRYVLRFYNEPAPGHRVRSPSSGAVNWRFAPTPERNDGAAPHGDNKADRERHSTREWPFEWIDASGGLVDGLPVVTEDVSSLNFRQRFLSDEFDRLSERLILRNWHCLRET